MSAFLRALPLICFILISGCSPSVELSTQNITNKAWVLTSLSQVGPEGFFLHPNGSVLTLMEGKYEKGKWFVENNALHLADAEMMSPLMVDEKVCLESSSTGNPLVFCAVEPTTLKSDKKYFPTSSWV